MADGSVLDGNTAPGHSFYCFFFMMGNFQTSTKKQEHIPAHPSSSFNNNDSEAGGSQGQEIETILVNMAKPHLY